MAPIFLSETASSFWRQNDQLRTKSTVAANLPWEKVEATDLHKQLSFSRVSRYLQCPKSFKLNYVDNVPQEPNVSAIMGNVLHNSIDRFANRIIDLGMKASLDDNGVDDGAQSDQDSFLESLDVEELKSNLLNEMSEVMREELNDGRAKILKFLSTNKNKSDLGAVWNSLKKFQVDQKHQEGMNILTQFIQRELDQGALFYLLNQNKDMNNVTNSTVDDPDSPFSTRSEIVRYPVLSESSFQFETDLVNSEGEAIIFKGIWDRVDKMITINEDGSNGEENDVIVEFKTRLYSGASEQHLLQIVLYMYAHLKIFEKLPERAILCSITTGQTVTWELHELMDYISKAEELLFSVSENIRLQKFDATPSASKCRICPFKAICDESMVSRS